MPIAKCNLSLPATKSIALLSRTSATEFYYVCDCILCILYTCFDWPVHAHSALKVEKQCNKELLDKFDRGNKNASHWHKC